MLVCCFLAFSIVAAGQVSRPGSTRGDSTIPQYPCGPTANPEKADVLVETQQVPPEQVLAEKDWPKLNPPELCQLWLIRLTNRAPFPAAFENYPDIPGYCSTPRGSFWLEGEQGQIGVSVAGCSVYAMLNRFLGLDYESVERGSPEEKALAAQCSQLRSSLGQYWSGVSLPKPLFGRDNNNQLARWVQSYSTEVLDELISHGPNTLRLRDLVRGAVQGGQDRATIIPQAQPEWVLRGPWPGLRQDHIRCSLWPKCSVWGYVLFQLNAPSDEATVCCDLGKAVTWCVVNRPDLAEDILKQEAQ